MNRNFGSVTGLTNQPQGLDVGLGGGSSVKSIQRGVTTLSSASTNVPISGVDLTKSVVRLMLATANTGAAATLIRGKLTSSTNLNLAVITYLTNTKVSWQVVEYNNVKSLQTGQITVNTANTTQVVSSVDTSKSELIISFTSTESSNPLNDSVLYGNITSNIQLYFEQGVATDTKVVEWQLLEFN